MHSIGFERNLQQYRDLWFKYSMVIGCFWFVDRPAPETSYVLDSWNGNVLQSWLEILYWYLGGLRIEKKKEDSAYSSSQLRSNENNW